LAAGKRTIEKASMPATFEGCHCTRKVCNEQRYIGLINKNVFILRMTDPVARQGYN